jgi:hypothetical protein
MPITFVSAFLDLSEDRTGLRVRDIHMSYFKYLADSGVNIHLFLNNACRSIYDTFAHYSNVYIESIELDALKSFTDGTLPAIRNMEKDTRNFLILMNAKPEFVYRAIQRNVFEGNSYYWIDFGIFHVIKNPEEAQRYLKDISSTELSTFIIPGCIQYQCNNQYFNQISWRFCGGVFAGDKDSLVTFYKTITREYDNIVRERGLTWEVNLWAYLESEGKIKPVWVHADHNDSILRIPVEYLLQG